MPFRVEFGVKGFAAAADGGNKLTTAHRGLLLDKYFAPKGKNDKSGSLPQWKALCDAALTPQLYGTAFQRWKTYAESDPQMVCFSGAIRGRMAIGLGIENVHEIGCRLHATYGVPVIPGSSLKGLLRAGLTRMPEYSALVEPLYGSQEQKGAVDVYDAWWMPPPPAGAAKSGLAPDVITVHHPKYYSGAPDAAPQDRESPVPNHFLTVTGDFFFAFRLQAFQPDAAENEKWKAFIRDSAQAFLRKDGIGAKRSSGYGRFTFKR